MKVHRAKEILQSKERIGVEFKGLPVWIDSVDADSETVKIHVEERPADSRVVSAEELQEVR